MVLLVDWDPIGIFGYKGAMDEYDMYVEAICRLLRSGATEETLAAHLDSIETKRMGHRGDPEIQIEAAKKLRQVYRTVQRDEHLFDGED